MSFPDATYDEASDPGGGTKRTAIVVELFFARRTEPAGAEMKTEGVSVATRKSWSSANTFRKSMDTEVPGAIEKGPAGRGGLHSESRGGVARGGLRDDGGRERRRECGGRTCTTRAAGR